MNKGNRFQAENKNLGTFSVINMNRCRATIFSFITISKQQNKQKNEYLFVLSKSKNVLCYLITISQSYKNFKNHGSFLAL